MNYEIEIISIVNEYRGKLSDGEVNNIIDLAKHNEWGVALDILCTQIIEYNLKISPNSFQKIEQMAKEMGLDEIDIDNLENLIKI